MDYRRSLINSHTKKFRYYDKITKKTISQKKTLFRIKSLKIPPNYRKVKINKSPHHKIQAIGEDNKGRKQYIYHPDFVEEQQEIKFKDLIKFGKSIKRIRKDYRRVLESNSDLDKNKIISLILYLLDQCNFRIGTEEYKKKYQTYGATTLNSDHILFKNGEVIVSFIGKKSVPNTSIIKNVSVKKILEELCHRNRNKDYLFYYNIDSVEEKDAKHITSSMITKFLKKYNPSLKPKMFRTWNGNSILLKYLLSKPKPKTDKEIKLYLRDAIKKVSQELHNTVAVVKKSYCNSEIYQTYLDENEKFFQFIDDNRNNNGNKKGTDRILMLFLIKYYQQK
jgi:DNA topoisomerase-1